MPVRGYRPHVDLGELLYGRYALAIIAAMFVVAIIVLALFG